MSKLDELAAQLAAEEFPRVGVSPEVAATPPYKLYIEQQDFIRESLARKIVDAGRAYIEARFGPLMRATDWAIESSVLGQAIIRAKEE